MVYTYNGKYYIKMTREFVEVNVTVDNNGNIILNPAGVNGVSIDVVSESNYKSITKEEIRNNFKKKSIEKIEETPIKKVSRFGKNI